MRRGFTVFELLAVVTITGLMALIALPRLVRLGDGAAVRQETRRLVLALDAARGTATRLATPVRLVLTDTSYVVESTIDSETVVEWRAGGPAAAGVGLSGAGAPITFGPAGIAMGVANRTLILTRGAANHRVVISRLGRITD
jgi:prepilin-type N-terminal cleavage/methylation domain-containing protein